MIVRWAPKKHYKAIASWYTARNLEAPLPHELPTIGFIVDNRVAGWLYQTDSSIALVDQIISNPVTLPSGRKRSIEVLVGVLLDAAFSLGFSKIMARSGHPAIDELCLKHNFNKVAEGLYILDETREEEDDMGGWDENNA